LPGSRPGRWRPEAGQDDRERITIDTLERLQRVMAARGVSSRRQAEEMIRAGRVAVDGAVVTQLGTKVDPQTAEIRVDGRLLRAQPLRYVLLNKPRGYITTTNDERGRETVMDLVPARERLYPVGRLDRDTEGLLLLTNDGDVANRVMHPRYRLAKQYTVLTPTRPPEPVLANVRKGVVIDGKTIVPEEFRILRETRDGVLLTITVHEGLNRLVRRIMDEAGIPVTRLRRVRIGPLDLGSIPEGTFRDLTPGELTSLLQALRLDREETGRAPRPVARGGPVSRSGPVPKRPTSAGVVGKRGPGRPARPDDGQQPDGAFGDSGSRRPRQEPDRGGGTGHRRDGGGRGAPDQTPFDRGGGNRRSPGRTRRAPTRPDRG